MFKKLGPRRFLRLFWATFRRKYFPKESELEADPRPIGVLERDMSTGNSFMLALILGLIFTFEPMVLLLLGWTPPKNLWVLLALMAGGLCLLAVPTSSAISMMVQINKSTDKIIDEKSNENP